MSTIGRPRCRRTRTRCKRGVCCSISESRHGERGYKAHTACRKLFCSFLCFMLLCRYGSRPRSMRQRERDSLAALCLQRGIQAEREQKPQHAKGTEGFKLQYSIEGGRTSPRYYFARTLSLEESAKIAEIHLIVFHRGGGCWVGGGGGLVGCKLGGSFHFRRPTTNRSKHLT